VCEAAEQCKRALKYSCLLTYETIYLMPITSGLSALQAEDANVSGMDELWRETGAHTRLRFVRPSLSKDTGELRVSGVCWHQFRLWNCDYGVDKWRRVFLVHSALCYVRSRQSTWWVERW